MKTKLLKNVLLLGCCFSFINAVAQNSLKQKTDISGKYNYFLHPDTVHRVTVNPFLWKDYPTGLNNPKDLKDVYKLALKDGDGYKLLQLAKHEFDNVVTYGNLVPSRMLFEAYQIALKNSDPYLSFYILRYDFKYNQSIYYTYEYMMKQVDSLATCHKNADVLLRLAMLDDTVSVMKHSTPARVRAKALFINNPGFAPYPNPYDIPTVDKPFKDNPFSWKNYPMNISTETQFVIDYKSALKNNDGYRLLQLAKVTSDKKITKPVTVKSILQKAYNIARYNKDPYLLLYVGLLYKDTKLIEKAQLSDIFRLAYNTAIERRDALPIYDFYNYEKENDFLPDVTPKMILLKGMQIQASYNERIIYNFQKWITPPLAKTNGNPYPNQKQKQVQSDDDYW